MLTPLDEKIIFKKSHKQHKLQDVFHVYGCWACEVTSILTLNGLLPRFVCVSNPVMVYIWLFQWYALLTMTRSMLILRSNGRAFWPPVGDLLSSI